ncbi:TPA: hypothetical protein N0F65_004264 [Lagenidium giganteum]|uniref:TLC domain-containing protein n=1 Tax=Lagenidium giganteum TaxID=4803 RepID=A0AAV2ZCX7_9STRA|nr:TPA: hypothetical protein N0F65_004264 [Lagenidium giganteum]
MWSRVGPCESHVGAGAVRRPCGRAARDQSTPKPSRRRRGTPNRGTTEERERSRSMPCLLTECSPTHEAARFVAALVGVYAYHFVCDTFVIRPIVSYCLKRNMVTRDKVDKMRESMWKNAAVGTFFCMGLWVGHDKDWFMDSSKYFVEWPNETPENLRWYYMIYLSFWFQSIDYLLNLTNKHYNVKRKDNAEMLVHHMATILLMVFSYAGDLTRCGICVLLIHDVNDLMLETAKIAVYLEWETVSNILFAIFAVTWYAVRWGFFFVNIISAVYTYGWDQIVVMIYNQGGYGGYSANSWYWVWFVFSALMDLLLVLHIYWGYLIFVMIAKTLKSGNVEKDIRSDSESEAVEEEDKAAPVPSSSDEASASGKPKRRRAPKGLAHSHCRPPRNATMAIGMELSSTALSAPAATTATLRQSTHVAAEKVRAITFLRGLHASDASDLYDVLPLVAAGGWDNEVNHVTLHLPILPGRDENELRREFGSRTLQQCELTEVAEIEHRGDVNALQFLPSVGSVGSLLLTASSTSSVQAFRVASSDVSNGSAGGASLAPFEVKQWDGLFAGAVTCLDASSSGSSVVAASETGELLWLQLNEAMTVDKIVNPNSSALALNGIKMLGQDHVVATVGSSPGSQLRLWDFSASNHFPAAIASDPQANGILTSIETHPTRPELLITGSEDGRVSFWDQRRLDTPFRTEAKHQRAVRSLKLHETAPRFLFSASGDATVQRWDFHHGRPLREAVEYEKHISGANVGGLLPHPASLQVQPITSSFQPWNALDIHAETDLLVTGSDDHSILVVQGASKAMSMAP